MVLAGSPGCASGPLSVFKTDEGRLADLGNPSADAEDKLEALVELSEPAEKDLELQGAVLDHATRLAEDDSVPVRLVAMRILARLGRAGVRTRESAQLLARHAEADKDFWCRIEALGGLSSLAAGPTNRVVDDAVRTQVRDALLRSLQQDLEPDRDVRIHAARELAVLRIEGLPVLERLVAALGDESHDVRAHAARALIAIAGEDHGPTKADWERWVRNDAPRTESR
jgi:hypothetical protein